MTHGDPQNPVAAPHLQQLLRSHTHFLLPAPHSWGSANSASTSQLPSFGAQTGIASKPIGALSRQTGSPPPGATGWRAEWPLRPWPFVRRRYTRGGQKPPCSAWPGLVRTDGAQKGTPNQAGQRGCYERSTGDNPNTVLTPLSFGVFLSPPTSVLGMGTQDHG